jgi:hypothetical protein
MQEVSMKNLSHQTKRRGWAGRALSCAMPLREASSLLWENTLSHPLAGLSNTHSPSHHFLLHIAAPQASLGDVDAIVGGRANRKEWKEALQLAGLQYIAGVYTSWQVCIILQDVPIKSAKIRYLPGIDGLELTYA